MKFISKFIAMGVLFYLFPLYGHMRGPSCIDVACDLLGHFGCDDKSKLSEVGMACRGNFDGYCLEAACSKLGKYGCDDLIEVHQVGQACVGNYDMSCFESVCQRLGKRNCNDIHEVVDILRTCAE
ncbi:MAG: hypothetical protein ACXWRE_00060 [Pseudobdellovibrionaceae bacterium]